MRIEADAGETGSRKDAQAPRFSKEAEALLAGAVAVRGNALDAVSHAMKFR